MNETLTRLLSGVIYAVLLLSSVFISEYTFVVLVFIFGCIALRELLQLLSFKSYLAYGILIGAFLFFNVFHYLNNQNIIRLLVILTLIINFLLIRDLLLIRSIPIFESRKYLITVFYLIASLVFMALLPHTDRGQEYNPYIIVGVFVLIWANDSFAYLIGKSMGRRKLFERISPNKTVEGFLGGLVLTAVISYPVFLLSGVFSFKIWLIIALITSIFGTFGDLIQSKLKRQAGVKDSGSIMPGHGGLLDRLDSILFASTFIYSFLLIINHVS